MLKKLCKCGKVINYNQKRCDECEQQSKQQHTKRHEYYDRYKRNKKSKAFYESKAWRRTRKSVLARYKGLDLYAFFVDKTITPATTIHHIVELTDNWSRRLDTKNLIPLSNSNHSKIHAMYEEDKEGTQKLLFGLLEKWRNKYV